MTCSGGSGARISMSCTRTRWATVCFSSIFLFLFLQAPSVSHMVFSLFFLSSFLLISATCCEHQLSIYAWPFFLGLFLGAITHLRPSARRLFFFSFSLSVRTVLSSHIRIVISPVVAVGAHATAVPQPAGPCYERVISGRKICNGVRDCRGSNEIQ